jgi:carbamoyltransferase
VELFEQIVGGETTPRFDRSFFDPGRSTLGGFSAKLFEALGCSVESGVGETLRAQVAAGVQKAVEKAVVRLAGDARNLCIAGGLGFNALLIAGLEGLPRFENVFVQPAAGNAGTALGAVLHVWHDVLREKDRVDTSGYLLGPEYSAESIKKVLENCKLHFQYLLTVEELVETAVSQITDHKIVAWMQGRMEFGPRALGNRSILASPLDPYSTENLNHYIKHREAFRKFAASVPAELADEYFETGANARYLASVGRVRPAHRETFAAALLGRDLIRVHTVRREDNPLYWNLLHAAGKRTGLPVLYNTSFNLFGEPLVASPRDAVRSFFSSGIDAMFVGSFFLQK